LKRARTNPSNSVGSVDNPSATKNGAPPVQSYSGRLGETGSRHNNFSFEKYEDLVTPVMSSLITEV
jgi:hypothetical protein